MARSWLIDGRGIATKVKNASLSPANQIKDCGANRECPRCHCRIDNADVSNEWPGFPAGVKFDPSDVEILEHLAAKCSVGSSCVKQHMFIDEFFPTVDKQEGICYTHPENLPGAKKDGSSVHFFHRTTNAYAIGQRKRRKIHNQHSLIKGDVRWHKTGKTKLVMENGVKKGYKKILVLYTISKKGSKPEKSNWVMHQYHLGTDEDEVDGHYVASKIFYQQQKQSDNNECPQVVEESGKCTIQTSPRTPNTNAPNPPWREKSVLYDDIADDCAPQEQPAVFFGETSFPSSSAAPQFKADVDTQCWLAGESQAVEGNDADDSLLCDEIFGSCVGLDDPALNYGSFSAIARDDIPGVDGNVGCGVADLENLELDTAPDNLPDLQFGSQDSILDWLDNI